MGKVAEQMDPLLDSQGVLRNESCLLAKAGSRVQCHYRVTLPGCNTPAVIRLLRCTGTEESHRVCKTSLQGGHLMHCA